jgi:small subunit ribosomal protein S16
MGRKKRPFYRIVVADSREKRDGKYIEKIGYYNPLAQPATVNIDKEKVLSWLEKGAIPTDTVYNLLQKEGIAIEWHFVRNKVGEQVRNIELQKWELAKKIRESGTEESVEKKESKPTEKTKKVTEAKVEEEIEEKVSEKMDKKEKPIEEKKEKESEKLDKKKKPTEEKKKDETEKDSQIENT